MRPMIMMMIGTALTMPTAYAQQPGIPGLRFQFAPLRAAAPVRANSDVATLQWTADTQAAVDQLRARSCPVTIDHVPPANELGTIPTNIPEQAQAIIGRVHGSSGYRQGLKVSQVTDEVCAPAVIAKDLDEWHYKFQFSTGLKGQQADFLERLPPGMMCYADNKTIGDFLRNFPLQFAGGNGPYQRYELPDEWQRSQMAPIIAQAAQSFSTGCHAWYEQQFFHPLIVRAEIRNKDIGNIQKIFASTGLAPSDWIVWEATKDAARPREYSDVEQFFNELNIAVQERVDKTRAALEFTPPEKGEFEKTADYNARIEQLRVEHDRDQDKLRAAADQDLRRARQQTFLQFVGQPEISEAAYDADKEQLRITVSSKTSPLRVAATVPVPLPEAQSVKSQLSSSTVHVLLGLKDGKFTVDSVVLWPGAEKIYAGNVLEYTRSPITFGKAAAEQWPKIVAAREDERRQRDFLRRQAEAARIQEEARSNPRLAFALQKARTGDARCNAIWSNAVAMARQPTIPESAWNEVVAKLEVTADRIGCP